MAERVTISIPDQRKELLEWVETQVEEGRFNNRSHAFWYAVKKMKDGGVEEVVV